MPLLMHSPPRHWQLLDEAATKRLAHACAQAAQPIIATHKHGLSLHLVGGLGAGKTTFVRHLLRSLGVQGRIKSPTYGLAESYEISASLTAWHFDFYRLQSDKEFTDAGFAELWAQPVLRLVEWPEHAAPRLAPADLALTLAAQTQDENARSVSAQARTAQGEQCLSAMAGRYSEVSA
jgi:tRNA threonylcarbamoyladenosine biosynthesis protein TsaE